MVVWRFLDGSLVASAANARYVVPVDADIDGGRLAALLNAAPALAWLLVPPGFDDKAKRWSSS